jgi:type I restriction enzyme S subunit
MELRPGYKQTEVGLLPADWTVSTFDETCRRLNAKPHQIQTSEYQRSGSLPVVDQGQKAIVGYTDQVERKFKCPDDGVIVFGDHTCIVKFVAFDFAVGADGTQLMAAKPDDCARFHAYGLEHDGIASTGYNRHFKFLRERLFIRPPLHEQEAIAAALGDVDALLSGLDRLIAKKRDLKQAAMQQLLTGQTRLPGFQGQWEVKQLGDLGVFFKGSGVKKDESRSGDLPCVRYGEIYTHHDDCIRSFNSWISRDVARTATLLRSGDLLFAGSGETKAEIGKCVAFVHDGEAYAGGDIVILRPAGVDPVFMGYYCNTSSINAQKSSKGQGDAVVHISAAALAAVTIALPTPAEQTAIATVLADMDTELSALEARRDKTRALKQGMMQDLLTGRIRLV